MYIAQAYKAKHEFWRYLAGSFIVFLASLVAQLPLFGAILLSVGAEKTSQISQSELFIR